MKAKVHQFSVGAKLPAGIIEGTEAFWFDNEKWLIHNGQTLRYNEAPTEVKRMIQEAFMADKVSHKIIKQAGITSLNETFDTWYRCVIGALDDAPDFVNGNLNADAYNHSCANHDCELRGKLCSLATGLKNYECRTIEELKKGETIEQAASELCLSVPGMKSRIEKLKEKLNAKNMAELIAKATQIGI